MKVRFINYWKEPKPKDIWFIIFGVVAARREIRENLNEIHFMFFNFEILIEV